METILIATDFSTAAHNASRYGFELSKALKAKVILFNVYRLPSASTDSLAYVTVNETEQLSYSRLFEEAEKLDPLRTVTLQTLSDHGPVTNAILTAAEENNASFIIVGMKDTGKEIRKLFGSTATALQKQTTIPIIAIPEKANFSIPKTIALAFDNTLETPNVVLEPLRKVVQLLNSKLYVVKVIERLMNEAIERLMTPSTLKSYLENLDPTYKIIKEDNVTKGLNNFVDEAKIDMLAVIPHEHHIIERFFLRSVTKDLLFHLHVPLLILPENKNQSVEYQEALTYLLAV